MPKSPHSNLHKIGLITKKNIGDNFSALKKNVDSLKKMGKDVLFDAHSGPLFNKKGYRKIELLEKADLILTLGGDGTLLKTAACMGEKSVLILGVNFGNLGFLTESTPQNLQQDLRKIFNGKFWIDERFLLRVTHYRKGEKVNSFLALNDAVINQGAFARLIEMRVEISSQKVVTFKSDGLIVSSPTGSTGHSLSAGGPIVHPSLPALILTPICPATLSIRPIVIPNDREIKITLTTARREHQDVGLTMDGQKTIPLEYGDQIKIRKSSRPYKLVRLKDQSNYYRMLRNKLHWGEHHGE